MAEEIPAAQRQTAVAAYFSSKQLLLFAFTVCYHSILSPRAKGHESPVQFAMAANLYRFQCKKRRVSGVEVNATDYRAWVWGLFPGLGSQASIKQDVLDTCTRGCA